MATTLQEIASVVNKSKVVISIAAGITTNFIEKSLSKGVRVIRVMPNTPALVGEGMAAVAAGKGAKAGDVKLARAIFNAVGVSVELNEKLMDAVTGLSGSGPAYFFLIIEALIEAGLKTDCHVIWQNNWLCKPCWEPPDFVWKAIKNQLNYERW